MSKLKDEEIQEVAKDAAARATDVKVSDDDVIFFSNSPKFSIIYKKEKRYADGSVAEPAESIKFDENMYITSDPDEIEFFRNMIKKSQNSAVNGVIECKNMDELMNHRYEWIMKRRGLNTTDIRHALEQTTNERDKVLKHSETVTIKQRK